MITSTPRHDVETASSIPSCAVVLATTPHVVSVARTSRKCTRVCLPGGRRRPPQATDPDALLHAAEEILGERSAEEVTAEELAARAGVAVSPIHNHFGSKAGLQAAVVDRALALDRSYMDRAYTDERSPAERVVAAEE